MSSLEGNKTVAAVLTAGIMAVGAGVIAGIIYSPHIPEEYAYAVDLPEGGGGAPAEVVEATPLPILLASADAASGEGVAKKCASCHSFDEGGANKVGPGMWGVVGRDIASADGFGYSDALNAMDGTWDYEALDGFLKDPKGWAPGTKMSFAGIRKESDRADLLLYLASVSPGAPALPAVEADAAEAPTEATDTEVAAASEEAPDAAEEVAESVEEVAEEATAEVAEVTEEAAQAAEEVTESVAEAAAEVAEETTEAVEEVAEAAEEVVNETAEAVSEAAEETAEAATEAAAGAAAVVVAAISGDAAAGEKVARKCKACHDFAQDGKNKVGPVLWGVVGRDIAAADGFNYSDAMSGKDGIWDPAQLDAFLAKPKEWAPGTKMAFSGLRKEDDRANIIAYLNSLSD